MDPGQIKAIIQIFTKGPGVVKSISDDVEKNGKPSFKKVMFNVIFGILTYCILFVGFIGLVVFLVASLGR